MKLEAMQHSGAIMLQQKAELPEIFTAVNDLDGLPKPMKGQYRCDACHQLQCAKNKSRHAKRCEPAYLLSLVRDILAGKKGPGSAADIGVKRKEKVQASSNMLDAKCDD